MPAGSVGVLANGKSTQPGFWAAATVTGFVTATNAPGLPPESA